jgi:phospholipase C
MKFHNQTDQDVKVGIYRAGNAWPGEDTIYWFTLFPFGGAKSIPKKGTLEWDSKGRFKRVQVIFWIGQEKIGPSSCSTSADVTLTPDKVIVRGTGPATIKDKITHFVVLMLENRSFDSVLGWLYADQHNKPSYNLPPQANTTYAGLEDNKYWNTNPASDRDKPGANRVYAKKVSSSSTAEWYKVPNPNPHEVYPYFVEQMFGTEAPGAAQQPDMSGFLANYCRVSKNNRPEQIMECYTPELLPVLSKLALEFAVGDRWFGSVPCETWPNRSFLHAGTSYGRLNNCDGKYDDMGIPNFMAYAGKRTVFDVLDEQEVSYCVFHDGILRPLVSYQFWTIG